MKELCSIDALQIAWLVEYTHTEKETVSVAHTCKRFSPISLRSCCLAQADFKFLILLPKTSQCRDFRCAPPHTGNYLVPALLERRPLFLNKS